MDWKTSCKAKKQANEVQIITFFGLKIETCEQKQFITKENFEKFLSQVLFFEIGEIFRERENHSRDDDTKQCRNTENYHVKVWHVCENSLGFDIELFFFAQDPTLPISLLLTDCYSFCTVHGTNNMLAYRSFFSSIFTLLSFKQTHMQTPFSPLHTCEIRYRPTATAF